jgi:hypothetical protein
MDYSNSSTCSLGLRLKILCYPMLRHLENHVKEEEEKRFSDAAHPNAALSKHPSGCRRGLGTFFKQSMMTR